MGLVVVVVAHIYPAFTGQRQTLTIVDPRNFHFNDYLVIGGIHTCLRISDDPMFLWISSN